MQATKTTLALALTAAFGATGLAHAADSTFSMQSLDSGYMVASADDKAKDGKCGEAKCGANKASADAKAKDGKCGEGKCGANKAADAKAKDGNCGASKATDKAADGSCGGKK